MVMKLDQTARMYGGATTTRPGGIEVVRDLLDANQAPSNLCLIAYTINGGATRDRTADLLDANQALSQLSYSPISW